MELKTLKLVEFKALGKPGTFTGYAAITGNRDLGGDRIQPGAFAKTLKDKKGRVPILDSHDPSRRIGVGYLEEDAKGLKVTEGVLNLDKQIAVDVWKDMQFWKAHDMSLGLSIGYDPVKKKISQEGDIYTRDLLEVALWEFSPVTFPMNPKAGVAGVKSLLEIPQEELTREVAFNIILALKSQLSDEDIKALLSTGAAKEHQEQPESAPAPTALQLHIEWLEEMKRKL